KTHARRARRGSFIGGKARASWFARRSWEERVRRTSAFASLQPFERGRKQGHGCVSEDGLVLERRCSPAAVERAKASGSDAVVRRLVRYYQGQINRAVAAATK